MNGIMWNSSEPTPELLDHFREPRNVGGFDPTAPGIGIGISGSAEAGQMVKLQVRVAGTCIAEARFKSFGCAATIACASLATEWLTGRTLDDADRITAGPLATSLRLAPDKLYCAETVVRAARAAIADFRQRQKGTQ